MKVNNIQELLDLCNKCILCGKAEYAEFVISHILETWGKNPDVLSDLAKKYFIMRKKDKAIETVKKSFDIQKSIDTLKLMADMNYEYQNFEDSAIQYEELTKHIKEDYIYRRCITSYTNLELEEEAIRVAKKYMEEMPSAESYATLGHLYVQVGMVQESLDCCKKAEELYPNNANINNLKGFTYEAILNEYEEAKKYYLKAAKQGFKSGYYNLGVCCKQSEDFANAEKYLKKYISLGPDTDVDYNYTLGSVYMAQRKMKLGYKYYEKRLSVQPLIDMNRRKLWDGKDYPDKTLLVYSEQGLGDNIQFVRYIPIAAKKFKKVYFATRENLVTLFQESFPPEEYPNIEVIKEGDSCRYNKFAMILDLPNIMHMTYHNVPAKQAYLRCNERTREIQKINYFQNDDLKIGLCWKAMGMGIRDAVYRTIDAPYYFKSLFDIPDIHFYSFQIGDIFGMLEKYPQITDLSQELTDFSQTAALLKNIDILITVDTALAHLAGALGIKTYLLLCKAPDWRWFDNNKKTEWYPSITIIRQKDRRSWEDVAAQLNEYIKKDAAKFRKSKKK